MPATGGAVAGPAPGPAGRRRADAQRNLEAILQAGLRVLSANPDAGLVDIARASGLTRTTVYAHFASREQLLDALVSRAIDSAAARVDAGAPEQGAPAAALQRVLQQSWREVNRHGGVSTAAHRALGAERMTQLHAPIRVRLLALIDRGQRDRVFRPDVPAQWLLGTYFALVHLAGDQVTAGALNEDDAEAVLLSTVTAAFTRDGTTVPDPVAGSASDPGRQDRA